MLRGAFLCQQRSLLVIPDVSFNSAHKYIFRPLLSDSFYAQAMPYSSHLLCDIFTQIYLAICCMHL